MTLRNPRFLAVSALCGALGVLSGYAIYLTYQQVVTADSEQHARLRFWLTLLVTALISYCIEWIREVIREGRIEHASHPIFRTVGTFIIVLMFELFVLGFHTTSDLSLRELEDSAKQLLGLQQNDISANLTLVFAAGLWMVVGALLAAWISRSVHQAAGTVPQRIFRGARNGLAGGVLLAPIVMALYIVAGRCLLALVNVFHGFGGGYAPGTDTNPLPTLIHQLFLSQNQFHNSLIAAVITAITLPVALLDMAAQKSIWLFFALYLPAAGYAVALPVFLRAWFLRRRTMLRIVLAAVWIVCFGYTVVPFATALVQVLHQLLTPAAMLMVLKVLSLPALLWAVPGLLLGGLTPLLRGVAAHTRNWAFVGYGAALLLIVATLLARTWLPLIPALVALAVGYLFQRGERVQEYWPFAALCVAAGICGATSIAQHFTFASEVHDLHAIDVLQPAPPVLPAFAGLIRSRDTLSPAERARVDASSSTTLAPIYTDDGHLIFVPVWTPDQRSLQQVQQILAQYGPQLRKQMEEDEAAHEKEIAQSMQAEQKIIASQPFNPFIVAAVKRANQPDSKTPPVPVPTANPETENPDTGTNPTPAQPPPPTGTQTSSAESGQPSASPDASVSAAPNLPGNAPADAASQAAEEDSAAKALELSLSGSVGFWVSVGLLACWSMQETDESAHPS